MFAVAIVLTAVFVTAWCVVTLRGWLQLRSLDAPASSAEHESGVHVRDEDRVPA